MLVCTFLLQKMRFFQTDTSCYRQMQKPAHRHIQTSFLFFHFFYFYFLKWHPLPLKSPSLVHCVCLDVFCRQTSSSLWENKTAPCYCYPKGLASQIHSSDRGKDSGERRMQRMLQSFQSNSLKRFGWDYLVLDPTSSVAALLIPRGALLFGPLSRDRAAQASPFSWHYSGCPHAVPRSLSSHRDSTQDFCIQLSLKQCDYQLDLF